MPLFGLISRAPKKRSGCRRIASRPLPRSKCTPIIAFSMPKWSISATTVSMGSASGSMSFGTSLNMYCAGNSNSSLDSLSMSPARRKPYQFFFEPSGRPSMRSTTPMSVGMAIGPD